MAERETAVRIAEEVPEPGDRKVSASSLQCSLEVKLGEREGPGAGDWRPLYTQAKSYNFIL